MTAENFSEEIKVRVPASMKSEFQKIARERFHGLKKEAEMAREAFSDYLQKYKTAVYPLSEEQSGALSDANSGTERKPRTDAKEDQTAVHPALANDIDSPPIPPSSKQSPAKRTPQYPPAPRAKGKKKNDPNTPKTGE